MSWNTDLETYLASEIYLEIDCRLVFKMFLNFSKEMSECPSCKTLSNLVNIGFSWQVGCMQARKESIITLEKIKKNN